MNLNRQQREAVIILYSNIAVIRDNIAYDANNNVVVYDTEVVQAYIDDHAYIAKRQAEYPQITDYIDGVVKGDQEQIDAYIAACQAVKTKYPKPE
jgi:hypothetical protein